MDINVFAKFYEIPSLPFQYIEIHGWTDNVKTVYPPNKLCLLGWGVFVCGGGVGGINTFKRNLSGKDGYFSHTHIWNSFCPWKIKNIPLKDQPTLV